MAGERSLYDPELKERRIRAQVETAEAKLAVLRGQLVEREAVASELRRMFGRMRSRLEALPDEMVAVIPPDQRQAILRDWRAKIMHLMRDFERLGDDYGIDVGSP